MEENIQTQNAPITPAPALVEEQKPEKTKKINPLLIAVPIIIVAVGLFLVFSAKKPQKVYHIGILSGIPLFIPSIAGFQEKMTELGYVEGKNVIYYTEQTNNVDPLTYKSLTEKLVSDKSDLILSFATEASITAKEVLSSTNIPLVFSIGGIEGNNLVDSVRHPGGNVTGVKYPDVADLSLSRLEILHEVLPKAKRVVLFSFPAYPIVPRQVDAVRNAAPSLGIEVVEVKITDLANMQAQVDAWDKSRDQSKKIDAVINIDGPTAAVPDAYAVVGSFAEKYHIPSVGFPVPTPVADKYKAVFSVLIDITEAGRQAAILADKILRGGIAAGSIPLPSAEVYIEVDPSAAQELGVTIPPELLGRANHIIR